MKVTLKTRFPLTDEAIRAATGKTFAEWFDALDARGGIARGRRDIGVYLFNDCKVDAWWSATLNIAYEAARGVLEKDARPKGYTICISKTVTAPLDRVYAACATPEALSAWFGSRVTGEVAAGTRFDDGDGNTGEWKRVRPNKDLRFSWETPSHGSPSQADVAFADKGKGKTNILVTLDRVQTPEAADGLRDAWGEALDRLKAVVESG